ncbi:hypothetical protein B0H13DRAFT_2307915 [Mycena leptocephala]|nr:hypothetical protein B0H13DRAFT_2307915 [Mycena leptocephala]
MSSTTDTLVIAAQVALSSNTGRSFPQSILDEIREMHNAAELGTKSLRAVLFAKTGRAEFGVEFGLLLTKRLPKDLWGDIQAVVCRLSDLLDHGEGFQKYGVNARDFFSVVGILAGHPNDRSVPNYVGNTFEDVLAAIESAATTISPSPRLEAASSSATATDQGVVDIISRVKNL